MTNLGGEQGEAWCDSSFKNTEKETDGNGTSVIVHSGEAAQDETPD